MDIIYIPGYCDTSSSFSELKKYLAKSKAYDLIGFGKEEKPEVEYDKKLFLSFLRKKITEKSILVGFSMGALVAKDFAIAYPQLVDKVFLISYPLQKSPEALRDTLKRRRLGRHYVDKTIWGRLLCNFHWVYRWIVILIVELFRPRYRYAIRGWFEHTYHSALSTMQNYILKNDPMEVVKIKDKAVIIVGQNDDLVDRKELVNFKYRVVPGMDHAMFGYEKEIAVIIKDNL